MSTLLFSLALLCAVGVYYVGLVLATSRGNERKKNPMRFLLLLVLFTAIPVLLIAEAMVTGGAA